MMFKESKSTINNFKLIEKDTFVNYSDDIELIFVELPKFNKDIEELENIKEQWIYFIKNAGSLEYIPNNLDKEIKKALDTVNEANLTKDELEAQHKRKEFISIQKLSILKAKEDGIEQGREEERKQLIINAYKNGTPSDTIASFVGMSEEEVIEFLRTVKYL